MGYHRVTRAELEAKLAELTDAGETITAVASDENGLDIFTTEGKKRPRPGQTETR